MSESAKESYARTAFEDELRVVRETTTEGNRNNQLNASAFNIGQLVGAGVIDRTEAERELFEAAKASGYVASDGDFQTLRTIRSGIDSGISKPRDLSGVGNDYEKAKDKRETASNTTGYVVRMIEAGQVKSRKPEWVWEQSAGNGVILRGALSLLAGRPNAGKSTAARWFASELTRGSLRGCFYGHPQNIAYLASEEALDYIVKPSLVAYGADLRKVTFPEVAFDGQAITLDSLRDEAALLEQLKAHGVSVLFVDPVMSGIGSRVDVNRNNEVRQYLNPWTRIAADINGAVIGVAHLRKNHAGSDILAAIGGSSAFGEVPRSVIAFAAVRDEDERVLSVIKNNAGRMDLSMGYGIEAAPVTLDDGESAEIGKFVLGNITDTRVEDLLLEVRANERTSGDTRTILLAVRQAGEPLDAAMVTALVFPDDDTSRRRNIVGGALRRLAKRGLLVALADGMYVPPKSAQP